MNTVILQHVCIGIDSAQIIDGDHINILAATFDNPRRTKRPIRPNPLIATLIAIYSLFRSDVSFNLFLRRGDNGVSRDAKMLK